MVAPARRRRGVAALTALLLCSVGLLVAPAAHGDLTTVSVDALRTGWDSAESRLSPADVSSSDFGQLFATKLDGQIYAQPVIAKSTLLAVTENDKAYGLDPETGAVKWTRDVGPSWPASTNGCGDLVPNVGITATPVYDPSSGTAYFTAKVNDGADAQHPHWYLHAVDITTGAERANFPVVIAGSPDNDPTHAFDPATAMQRPGLLLLNGVVYAGFASHCDYGAYVGYVMGWNATTGKRTAMWATESGTSSYGAGIWQSGGGLVSDGAGRIFITTGNGISPAPGPGTSPPANLAESVVRLQVNSNGTLTAKDFFSPVNNSNLDRDDSDLGSGGAMAIPDGYGTAAHPHLLVQIGKDGRLFLLDRDNLGGDGQGSGGTDAVLASSGPYNGVWGHPALWGGDGGYVYLVTNGGPLLAFKIGVDGNGVPSLAKVGASAGTWGYTSGSPVVTSTGSTSGSALVWAVYASGSNGAGGQLRAYDAVPVNGVLTQRYAAPIGTATKFAVPATDNGRVYTGTRDGTVYGFGRPAAAALTGSPTAFGQVAVGGSAQANVTLTATRALTVTAASSAAPFSVTTTALPVSLTAGQTVTLPASFAPTAAGTQSGNLSVTTSAGTFGFALTGSGTKSGLGATPASIAFGDVPTTGSVSQTITVTNTGTANTTITGTTAPAAPFAVPSAPKSGTVLAPGGSVSVAVTFAPTTTGPVTGSLVVTSSTGSVTVPLSGNGVAGAAHLTLTPTSLDFGTVQVGATVTKTFDVSNTGNLLLTLQKAAPPTAPFSVPTPVSEGQQLEPDTVIHQSVSFTPTATGSFSGQYLITGNDGQGPQTVSVKGTAVAATTLPVPAPGSAWTLNGAATTASGTTTLTTATTYSAGSAVYGVPVASKGLHVSFTARIGSGTGADGMTFSLLDATKTTSAALGKVGGALGYGSLPGVAVALDTFQNGNDPSSNFYGIATGATGANSDVLTWAATAPAKTALTSGTHTVDVLVTATGLSVSVDGGARLTASVTVPASALLAFTAGTGGLTDVHAVSGVTITTPAPVTGAVAGLAGGCLDVSNGASADRTPLQRYACNGTAAQTWTLPGDRTLRALGKCMAVTTGATAAGTPVYLDTCAGTASQTWQAQADGTLRNPQSGRCLASTGTGTPSPLVIADCSATATQQWRLPGGVVGT